MKHRILRKAISFLLVSATMFTLLAFPSFALTDPSSAGLGFSVDLDQYEPVEWIEHYTTISSADGVCVGTTVVDVGVTRSKSQVKYLGQWYYLDAVLYRMSYTGSGGRTSGLIKKYYYGYVDYLEFSSTLATTQQSWAHDPKQEKTETSYEIGLSAGTDNGGTFGISAGHTFTKKALDLDDYSNPANRLFKVRYDYNQAFWKLDWELNKYSYNYTDQIGSYSYLTKSSSYCNFCSYTVKYQLYNDSPSFWADSWGFSNTYTYSFTLFINNLF